MNKNKSAVLFAASLLAFSCVGVYANTSVDREITINFKKPTVPFTKVSCTVSADGKIAPEVVSFSGDASDSSTIKLRDKGLPDAKEYTLKCTGVIEAVSQRYGIEASEKFHQHKQTFFIEVVADKGSAIQGLYKIKLNPGVSPIKKR